MSDIVYPIERLDSQDTSTEDPVIRELAAEMNVYGLTQNETRVYIYLLRAGSKKASEISKSTGIHRTETYHLLMGLQDKGLVSGTFTYPLLFMATPLPKALDLLVSIEKDRVHLIESRKHETVRIFGSLSGIEEQDQSLERFIPLSGLMKNYSTAVRLLKNTESSAYVIGGDLTIGGLYRYGFFEALENAKTGLDCRIVGNFTERSHQILEELGGRFKVRSLKAKSRVLPGFVLVDSSELLFFANGDEVYGRNMRGVYTNLACLASSMRLLFGFLWSSGEPLLE